jgi:hypothetical protein
MTKPNEIPDPRNWKDGMYIVGKPDFTVDSRKRHRRISCKDAEGNLVALFDTVEVAANYVASKVGFSMEYVRNKIYKGINKKDVLFGYVWEDYKE